MPTQEQIQNYTKLAIDVHNVMVEHHEAIKQYLSIEQLEQQRNAIDKTHSLVEALKVLRA